MFALHETTRKRVCRAAFFALCVGPTLATGCWIASHHWPGGHGRISRELGRTLGVHVKLADWREPRPRTVRTSGMTLSDGGSGHSLVDMRLLEWQRGGGSHVLRVDEATIDASQLDEIAGKIDGWLALLPPQVHEVRCRRLAIRLPSTTADSKAAIKHAYVLHQVQVRIDRDAGGRLRVQGVGFARETQDPTSTVRIARGPQREAELQNR